MTDVWVQITQRTLDGIFWQLDFYRFVSIAEFLVICFLLLNLKIYLPAILYLLKFKRVG
jgi:hypothetical protein